MVKGISKRVVIVRSHDSRVFDEAIFILREDADADRVSQTDLLREATTIVTRGAATKKPGKLRLMLAAASGGSAVGIAWFLAALIK